MTLPFSRDVWPTSNQWAEHIQNKKYRTLIIWNNQINSNFGQKSCLNVGPHWLIWWFTLSCNSYSLNTSTFLRIWIGPVTPKTTRMTIGAYQQQANWTFDGTDPWCHVVNVVHRSMVRHQNYLASFKKTSWFGKKYMRLFK